MTNTRKNMYLNSGLKQIFNVNDSRGYERYSISSERKLSVVNGTETLTSAMGVNYSRRDKLLIENKENRKLTACFIFQFQKLI